MVKKKTKKRTVLEQAGIIEGHVRQLEEILKNPDKLLEARRKEKPYTWVTWLEMLEMERKGAPNKEMLKKEIEWRKVLLYKIPSYVSLKVMPEIKKKYRLSKDEVSFVSTEIQKAARNEKVLSNKEAVRLGKKGLREFDKIVRETKRRLAKQEKRGTAKKKRRPTRA